MKEGLLDLQTAYADLEILFAVKGFKSLGPFRTFGIAVAVEPAVCALFAKVLHVKCVVGARGIINKRRLIIGLYVKSRRPAGGQQFNVIACCAEAAAAAAAGDSNSANCKNEHGHAYSKVTICLLNIRNNVWLVFHLFHLGIPKPKC